MRARRIIIKISYFIEWDIIMIRGINLGIRFYIDKISLLFFFRVIIISSCVRYYSLRYIEREKFFFDL